jgi:ketosteroid isomerase-like protein
MGEELQVVADQQQAAGALAQRLLQAFNGRQVKVVCGLVHDDEVGAVYDTKGQQHLAKFAGACFNGFKQPAGERSYRMKRRQERVEDN